MVKPMHEQSPSVKLLTILNVQSAKPPSSSNKKRSTSTTATTTQGPATRDWHAIAKKAKKIKVTPTLSQPQEISQLEETVPEVEQEEEEEEEEDKVDQFKHHFGSLTPLVENVEKGNQEGEGRVEWDKKRVVVKGLGECLQFEPSSLGDQGNRKSVVEGSGLSLVSFLRHDFAGERESADPLPAYDFRFLTVQSQNVG